MSQITIQTSEGEVNLEHEGFDYDFNVNDITDIHYENIEGEILGVATDLNKMGMLRAEAERVEKKQKFALDIYSAQFNRNVRREAAINSNHFTIGGDRIKLTEGSIKDALYLDEEYQKLKNTHIEAEAGFETMDSIYWGVKEKAKKLDKLNFRDSLDGEGK